MAGVSDVNRLAADLTVFYVILFRERQVQQYGQAFPAKGTGDLSLFLHSLSIPPIDSPD
jgi:hypothetical protein